MIRSLGSIAVLMTLGGCGISPLSNRIEVGKNPFVVFVGEGVDHRTDLFASEPSGGRIYQLTFTPVLELQPRIIPDGSMIAFLRMKDSLPGTPRDLIVMNLVSGSDRKLALPAEAGNPETIAWSDDAQWIYVVAEHGRWRLPAPPADTPTERLSDTDAATDSAMTQWAGIPRFARIAVCPSGGVCLVPPQGDTVSIAAAGRDGFAWGADSVAWFERDEMVVRSLGAGIPRRVSWKNAPAMPRAGTYAGR